MCDAIDQCLDLLKQDDSDDLAIGVSRLHATSTSMYENNEIFCFGRNQNIANYTISLAVRNDYEFITEIRRVIWGVLEGGLNIKWQRENPTKSPRDDSNQFLFLRMGGFITLFYFVYFPGLFLAFSTFCLELFVASKIKKAQTARGRKFWMKFGHMLNGRRHMFKLQRKRVPPESQSLKEKRGRVNTKYSTVIYW